MDDQELRATMLAALLGQGVPVAQAVQDAEAAVAYVLSGAPAKKARGNRDTVLGMWFDGLSAEAIARKLGMSAAGVRTAITQERKRGDPRAVRRMTLTPEQIDAMRQRGAAAIRHANTARRAVTP